jgi:hypothetical protein
LNKCISSNGEYFEGDWVFFVRNVNKSSFLKKILLFFWSPLARTVHVSTVCSIEISCRICSTILHICDFPYSNLGPMICYIN